MNTRFTPKSGLVAAACAASVFAAVSAQAADSWSPAADNTYARQQAAVPSDFASTTVATGDWRPAAENIYGRHAVHTVAVSSVAPASSWQPAAQNIYAHSGGRVSAKANVR